MKYTLTINQKVIIEKGHPLDIIDAAILQVMKGMQGANGITKVVSGNIDYYWMSHQKLCDELPVLRMKKDSMYRRVKKLVAKNYIAPHPQNKAMRATYYRVTALTDSLFNSIGLKSDISDTNPKGIGFQSGRASDENPKDNNTIDKETIDKNIAQSKIDAKQKQENDLLKAQLAKLEAKNKKLAQSLNKHSFKEQVTIEGKPPSFDEFWDLYAKKVGKKTARKHWGKLKSHEKIKAVTSIEKYKSHLASQNWDKQQMHPSTYLNGKRFNDEFKIETNGQAQQKPTAHRNGSRPSQKFRDGVDGFLNAYSKAISIEDLDFDEPAIA